MWNVRDRSDGLRRELDDELGHLRRIVLTIVQSEAIDAEAIDHGSGAVRTGVAK